ncbi:acid-resistant locus arl7 [alpha proteobacterium U9-1i]|nr:acid-resistant locus arl7 [alpha proteobacterium U9-1i]
MVIETVLALAGAVVAGSAGKDTIQRVFYAFRKREPISRDLTHDFENRSSFGERLADRVAEVGGSWAFVSSFFAFLVVWAALNILVLPQHERFDPYPFIFLNLLLSMLAAVQAPIIMMSQNRQAVKDRIEARHDFEVNLKAELEILSLHEKLDRLHAEHGAQLAGLRALLEGRKGED